MGIAAAGRRTRGWPTIACILIASCASFPAAGWADSRALKESLTSSLHAARASGVVLDWKTGSVVAVVGPMRSATPGSTLKPLLLAYALRHGILNPETRVFCTRNLRVGARAIPCTHPADENVFTAADAIAESCNSYFAEMARRFSSPDLEAALREARIPHRPLDRATVEERELATLGLHSVTVTPLELAQAYRSLALTLQVDGPVSRGLAGSVNYGMASGAAVSGMTILGKTGTAKNPNESWTHGWFAGIWPGRLIFVVFVPKGDGGLAAHLARSFLITLPRERSVR